MQYVKKHFFLFFILILLGVAFFTWNAVFALQGESGILEVDFLDIGQGDAIFIQAPGGVQVLIDGGPPNKRILSELGKVTPFYDRSIDIVIATHADADHIGGLPDALERYDVGFIYDSGSTADTDMFRAWIDAIEMEHAVYKNIFRGARIYIEDDIWLDVLYPFEGQKSADANDMSIVAKLVYGGTCFILTGDLERNGEVRLLGDYLECSVLKVGHHGSKTSTSDAFLRAVSPDIAVISAGKDNRYGHPHEVIMDKLNAAGITIARTDTDGTLVFFSDGMHIWQK